MRRACDMMWTWEKRRKMCEKSESAAKRRNCCHSYPNSLSFHRLKMPKSSSYFRQQINVCLVNESVETAVDKCRRTPIDISILHAVPSVTTMSDFVAHRLLQTYPRLHPITRIDPINTEWRRLLQTYESSLRPGRMASPKALFLPQFFLV